MTHILKKKLNNGLEIPIIGLGTFKEDKSEVLVNAVKAAIKSGYRHFDCAYVYHNEEHIGKAIKESIQESNGKLKREDFFLTSKCWNTFHTREKAKQCLVDILKRLETNYLDLYLVHWPMGFKDTGKDFPSDEKGKCIPDDSHYVETYQFLEELVDAGLTKSIGLSNYNPQQVQDVLKACRIRPACNQFEVNPFLPNDEWVDFCQKENITVVAYAPFGAPDRSWAKTGDPVSTLEIPLIVDLAKKYKKKPGQIILRWLIQRGIVAIPKSVTPSRIEENSQVFDFELSQEDFNAFKQIKENFRFYWFDMSDNHPFYPFKK